MDANTIRTRGRRAVASFLEHVKKSSEPLYLSLLTVYIMTFYVPRVFWAGTYSAAMDTVKTVMTYIAVWGAAAYLFSVCAGWLKLRERKILMAAIGAALAGLTAWFSGWMSSNAYTVVLDVFFCVMVCGKSYKKCLRCIMCVAAGTLLVAAVGVFAQYARDVVKPDNVSPGHSFGIIYPNTWGYTAFSAMMIFWYLYLRRKAILTFALFWPVALFMFFVISCRTIAALAILFPMAAALIDWLESRSANPLAQGGGRKTMLRWLAASIPFAFFALTLALCLNYEWVHKHFYGTALHTLAMRFVQGGLYLKMYGTNLWGNPYSASDNYSVVVNGVTEALGILDNSFVSYIVVRGVLWVLGCLLWQSLAIWKGVKRRDYAIPFLCATILAYATMERPGLNIWYNFILLYPLAAIGAAGPKEVERP